MPENVRIVPDPASPDNSSLHIVVDDPGSQRKYAEYFLPVSEGKFYQAQIRIRTRNIQRHPQGGRNRGAVLFLQLADRNRKHVPGGSFPRGLSQDNDWMLHRIVSTNRMPAEAAYLHVMIGIEGQGEAWFDDLKVTEITPQNFQGLSIVSPDDQETIHDLRPTFTVREGGAGVRQFACRIELSQDPQFPADQVLTEELSGSPHQLTQWLTPGAWHYRLIHRVGGVELPAPPSRSLVIADTASAWPPIMQPQWQWSDTPRPELEVRIGYPKIDQLQMTLTINGAPAELLDRTDDRIRFRPQTDLPPGAHHVRMELARDGQTEVLEHVFSNQTSPVHVTFRHDRVMLINGEPFYPLGTYRDPSDSVHHFDGVLAGGFNLTHDYLFEHAPQDVATARSYLDRAHERGLKVFMGIPREKVHEQDTLWIQHWVASLMDHPALLLWYLMDEPEKQGVSPATLRQVAQTVRAIDPFHPTTVVYCMPRRFHEWSEAHDLHWNDPYPLPNRPLTWVEHYTREARKTEGDQGPVWTVLQGFDYRYARGRERFRAFDQYGKPDQPTRLQTRFMAFAALASGSDGLVWYWLPKSAYDIVEDSPQTWQGIVDTVALFKKLTPWLIAENPPQGSSFDVPEPFRIWSREVGTERILAVMNASDQDATLPLDLKEREPTAVSDFESGEALPLRQHRLDIDLAPWEVRILLIRRSLQIPSASG